MKGVICGILLVLLASPLLKATVLVHPVSQTVLQGDTNTAVFQCNYTDMVLNPWLIVDADGTELNATDGAGLSPAKQLEKNITYIGPISIQRNGQNFKTTSLKIVARPEYNNTEIRCVSSSPALLRIQDTQLDAPTSITVTAINMTTWYLNWQAPFTLNISNTSTYYIQIKDIEQNTSVNINTTHTEHYHHPSSCQRRMYEVRVAAGYEPDSGPYSEPVGILNNFLLISSPNKSGFLETVNQFTCEAPCNDSLLVTWLINGRFPSQLGSQVSVRLESNYSLQCASGSTHTTTLEVMGDIPTPSYTVQCAAVSTCDETTPCTFELCQSDTITVNAEGTEPWHSSDIPAPDPEPLSDSAPKALGVGVALGVVVLLCLVVISTLSVFICWKFALKKKDSGETNGVVYKHSAETDSTHYEAKNDVYEHCGDPVSVAGILKRDVGPSTVLYDQPAACVTTSCQLPVRPVAHVAYDKPRPRLVTEPCVAYEALKEKNTETDSDYI